MCMQCRIMNLAVFLLLFVARCSATCEDYDNYDGQCDEEETDSPSVVAPDMTTCNSPSNFSRCLYPRPALRTRSHSEEEVLLLADCYLQCLEIVSYDSRL